MHPSGVLVGVVTGVLAVVVGVEEGVVTGVLKVVVDEEEEQLSIEGEDGPLNTSHSIASLSYRRHIGMSPSKLKYLALYTGPSVWSNC